MEKEIKIKDRETTVQQESGKRAQRIKTNWSHKITRIVIWTPNRPVHI